MFGASGRYEKRKGTGKWREGKKRRIKQTDIAAE